MFALGLWDPESIFLNKYLVNLWRSKALDWPLGTLIWPICHSLFIPYPEFSDPFICSTRFYFICCHIVCRNKADRNSMNSCQLHDALKIFLLSHFPFTDYIANCCTDTISANTNALYTARIRTRSCTLSNPPNSMSRNSKKIKLCRIRAWHSYRFRWFVLFLLIQKASKNLPLPLWNHEYTPLHWTGPDFDIHWLDDFPWSVKTGFVDLIFNI